MIKPMVVGFCSIGHWGLMLLWMMGVGFESIVYIVSRRLYAWVQKKVKTVLIIS